MVFEVEVRSFISEQQYAELLKFFRENSQDLGSDEQESHYFNAPVDVRIQQNSFFSKIWLKKGKMHEVQREELEIHFPREDFEKLGELFATLGFSVSIKWLRQRHSFEWEGVKVMLDCTKGYGYIIELEKMAGQNEVESTKTLLLQKLSSLKVPLTPKEVFDQKFADYKQNWKSLLQ